MNDFFLESPVRAKAAVAPFLSRPPATLRDMRRPDDHREAFVCHKIRARNKDNWAGMPAVKGSGGVVDEAWGELAGRKNTVEP